MKNIWELAEGVELFTLECGGEKIAYSDFSPVKSSEAVVDGEYIYSEEGRCGALRSRVVILEKDGRFKAHIQMAADWPNGIQQEVKIHLSFLADIFSARPGKRSYFFTSGSKIIQPHRYFLMPYCVIDENTGDGFSIRFENLFNENWIAWDQNRGTDMMFNIKDEQGLRGHNIVIRPSGVFADMFILDMVKTCDGFSGFFQQYKQEERAKLDLSLYERQELKWYRETVLQHFTYVFGKESFDYRNQQFMLDKLLLDGEEFGGYDSLILWHQYPRLGVDKRSQWEFFDDFPAYGGDKGRAAIRKITEAANEKGVKVFLPFKPWDVDSDMSEAELTADFVQLLRDTGVNGMFFDTMTAVPEGFRAAADEVDTSFAFCTEGKPRTVENLARITGSWDQFWNKDCVLEINIARYILPENAAPMISRWHVGESRERFIKRAIWNGSGLVVWQDVFGAWCPFSDEHKAIIKKWKGILKANTDIFFGSEARPLLDTMHENLYCNYFSDGAGEIYSLYNHGDSAVSGPLIKTQGVHKLTELWYGREVTVQQGVICGEILPKEILIIKCEQK